MFDKCADYIVIDFEYRRSFNKTIELVCAAIKRYSSEFEEIESITFWLHKNNYANLRKYVETNSNAIFICFQASAEARSIFSLGVDPRRLKWIDLFVEWAMARNNNINFMYGKIKKPDGRIITSRPILDRDAESHEKVGGSLSDMCLNLLDVDIDKKHKTVMRDLILRGGDFSEEERSSILDYCASDVHYLIEAMKQLPQFSPGFHDAALWRGRSSVNMAICETNGYPLDEERLFSVASNYPQIIDGIIHELNDVYPFFVREKNRYVQKYVNFERLITEKNLGKIWPRSIKTKKFETTEETLTKFSHIPEISEFLKTRKLINSIKWFRPEALPVILDRVGDDMRVRSWLKPYGTATSRNAPPAKTFFLAMSSWARSLIRPPVGRAITGIDWNSQEVAIAAALSNDTAMISAYNSGDPYMAFAIQAGAAPKTAKKSTHRAIRDDFKDTKLAVQFGMGAESLALIIALKKALQQKEMFPNEPMPYIRPDEDQAIEMIGLHQEIYWKYHEFLEKVERQYRKQGFYALADGWILWRSNDREKSILSVRNQPMQGTGAVIMRHSLDRALDKKLMILSPLHDAFYVEHGDSEDETASTIETLEKCMDYGVHKVLGGKIRIRTESKTIRHADIWTENKAIKTLKIVEPFLTSNDWWLLKMFLIDGRS